ncbi:MAG: hypothetical protein F6K28_37795 [Microcoleus sp. SIO2G3]|nr:hypothetical protein [Microcoleus sp. SIO2G3]
MSDDKPYACGTAAPIGFTVACGGKAVIRAASPLCVYAFVVVDGMEYGGLQVIGTSFPLARLIAESRSDSMLLFDFAATTKKCSHYTKHKSPAFLYFR